MKLLSEIMSNKSKEEYLENCRARYPSRNKAGRTVMIDEVSDTMGWDRKHTIKALNGKVSLGKKANKRGSKPIYGELEKAVIVEIWKLSEQPCGKRLKETIPLWLSSYERRYAELESEVRKRLLTCSPRQLDRITQPHRMKGEKRYGRSIGRTSHRLKTLIPVKCGPQDVDQPGYMEVDTVSHGGGSSSGEFMWSLTMTDIHCGWTDLYGLWGCRGSEVRVGVSAIEARLPFELLGFDCDNGSEFLNEVLENYLLERAKSVEWTRSRPYKKNDQAHVEQKNYTHVRQLLGYGRFSDLDLVEMVNDLYNEAWLPMRNYFTPVMKLVEKERVGSKVKKTYDTPKTPCDRLLSCEKVDEGTKSELRKKRASLDPIDLSEEVEKRLNEIFECVREIEEQRAEEDGWLSELEEKEEVSPVYDSVPSPVANAPSDSTESQTEETLVKEAI